MAGFSIPTAEHSTITAWGQRREREAYENMLDQFAGQPFIAVVSDSYDLWNAIRNIWGKSLKDKVIKSGSMLVVRPDSGDPAPIVLQTLKLLDEAFGTTINTKGYKVLNNVRVIQGDGINQGSIAEILRTATLANYSASNIAFGMGGALLQQVNRDTQRFAYKCSATKENGLWYGRCKNPATDPGKASKEGRLDLIRMPDGKFATVLENPNRPATESEMVTVFENGQLTKTWTLEQVRARAKETTLW
jgi:nicotinamide phosphoribosyltransferase